MLGRVGESIHRNAQSHSFFMTLYQTTMHPLNLKRCTRCLPVCLTAHPSLQNMLSLSATPLKPYTCWLKGAQLTYPPVSFPPQDLPGDAQTLSRELHPHAGPLGRRVDAVVLVHNLASKVPQLRGPRGKPLDKPALSVLINEVRRAGRIRLGARFEKFASGLCRTELRSASGFFTVQSETLLAFVWEEKERDN